MTDQPRTSREKVPEKIAAMADGDMGLGPMFGAMVPQLMPLALAKLPEDPAVLDELLHQLAGEVLAMRSDDAPVVYLEHPNDSPPGES